MKEVGIMGGTFNPIHNLHLLVAQLAGEQFLLDRVLFIPTGRPPHKRQGLLGRQERFEMVEAGVRGNKLFEASRLEIDRPGVTWSIDTLYALKELYGEDVRLSFIFGDDNLPVLRDYDRRAEFVDLCRILVCPRRYKNTDRRQRLWRKMVPEADMAFIDCPLFPVSSTLVRDWVREGRSIRYLVPASVASIVSKRRHYQD